MVVEKLGIADAIKPKAVVVDGTSGARVGAVVASGEAEMGLQLMSELLPIAGIDVIGPIPEELQTQTSFSAAVPAKAKDSATARMLVNYLRSEAATDLLKRKGLDVPW